MEDPLVGPAVPGQLASAPSGSLQPVPNHNPWMLLYFISFLLIVSFFVLNMFVGVVVENFHKCRQHQEAEEARRREEKRQRRLERKRRSKALLVAVVGWYLWAGGRAVGWLGQQGPAEGPALRLGLPRTPVWWAPSAACLALLSLVSQPWPC